MAKKKDQVLTLEFFRQHGARGGKLGGKKSSENMTPEQRSERARKAVAARKWHPLLTDEEKAERAKAKIPRKVGRPRKVVEETPPARPVGRPRKPVTGVKLKD
jgi:hypothetical protein